MKILAYPFVTEAINRLHMKLLRTKDFDGAGDLQFFSANNELNFPRPQVKYDMVLIDLDGFKVNHGSSSKMHDSHIDVLKEFNQSFPGHMQSITSLGTPHVIFSNVLLDWVRRKYITIEYVKRYALTVAFDEAHPSSVSTFYPHSYVSLVDVDLDVEIEDMPFIQEKIIGFNRKLPKPKQTESSSAMKILFYPNRTPPLAKLEELLRLMSEFHSTSREPLEVIEAISTDPTRSKVMEGMSFDAVVVDLDAGKTRYADLPEMVEEHQRVLGEAYFALTKNEGSPLKQPIKHIFFSNVLLEMWKCELVDRDFVQNYSSMNAILRADGVEQSGIYSINLCVNSNLSTGEEVNNEIEYMYGIKVMIMEAYDEAQLRRQALRQVHPSGIEKGDAKSFDAVTTTDVSASTLFTKQWHSVMAHLRKVRGNFHALLKASCEDEADKENSKAFLNSAPITTLINSPMKFKYTLEYVWSVDFKMAMDRAQELGIVIEMLPQTEINVIEISFTFKLEEKTTNATVTSSLQ